MKATMMRTRADDRGDRRLHRSPTADGSVSIVYRAFVFIIRAKAGIQPVFTSMRR
jgi:hypothetical protein